MIQKEKKDLAKSNNAAQYIIIRFDNEEYGINIKYIQNIIRMSPITRVPNSKPYILGVINLRGDIVPVTSLRIRFNLGEDEIDNKTRIIIVQMGEALMGLLVDEVLEAIELDDDTIEKLVKDGNDEKEKYIFGVGKIGNRLVSLFSVKSLLESEQKGGNK